MVGYAEEHEGRGEGDRVRGDARKGGEGHEESSSFSLPFFIFFKIRLTRLKKKKFIINASQPASDKIFDVAAFEKFLHDKIKVDNRVGNLGDTVVISQLGDGKIEVVAHTAFSGRYLKYLYVYLCVWGFNGGGEL